MAILEASTAFAMASLWFAYKGDATDWYGAVDSNVEEEDEDSDFFDPDQLGLPLGCARAAAEEDA